MKIQFEERNKKQQKSLLSLKSELREMALEHNRQIDAQRNAMINSIRDSEDRTDEKNRKFKGLDEG